MSKKSARKPVSNEWVIVAGVDSDTATESDLFFKNPVHSWTEWMTDCERCWTVLKKIQCKTLTSVLWFGECFSLRRWKHLCSWERITQTIYTPSKIHGKISLLSRCSRYLKSWSDSAWKQISLVSDEESLHVNTTQIRNKWEIAERAVRRVKEGTSAVLLQLGLNENWLADSMECHTYRRNVTDLLSDGKTPYEIRFGQPFKGPIIPFGSLVEYHPITAKDQSRILQFGKRVLPGWFLWYAPYAGEIGRVTYWLQTLRSWRRWTHRKSAQKDSMLKRWYFTQKGEFIFPVADGRIEFVGGD